MPKKHKKDIKKIDKKYSYSNKKIYICTYILSCAACLIVFAIGLHKYIVNKRKQQCNEENLQQKNAQEAQQTQQAQKYNKNRIIHDINKNDTTQMKAQLYNSTVQCIDLHKGLDKDVFLFLKRYYDHFTYIKFRQAVYQRTEKNIADIWTTHIYTVNFIDILVNFFHSSVYSDKDETEDDIYKKFLLEMYVNKNNQHYKEHVYEHFANMWNSVCLLLIDDKVKDKYKYAIHNHKALHRQLFSTILSAVKTQEYNSHILNNSVIHIYAKIQQCILTLLNIQNSEYSDNYFLTLCTHLYIHNAHILDEFVAIEQTQKDKRNNKNKKKEEHKHKDNKIAQSMNIHTALHKQLAAWKKLHSIFNVHQYNEIPNIYDIYNILTIAQQTNNDINYMRDLFQQLSQSMKIQADEEEIQLMAHMFCKLNENFHILKSLKDKLCFLNIITPIDKKNQQEYKLKVNDHHIQKDELLMLEYIKYVPLVSDKVSYVTIHHIIIKKHKELLQNHSIPECIRPIIVLSDNIIHKLSNANMLYVIDITPSHINTFIEMLRSFNNELLYHK